MYENSRIMMSLYGNLTVTDENLKTISKWGNGKLGIHEKMNNTMNADSKAFQSVSTNLCVASNISQEHVAKNDSFGFYELQKRLVR